MENPKFPCSQHPGSSIYEKSSVNSKEWWKRLFEIMVEEVCVPPHLRVDVLEEIFPHKIFENICTILNIGPKSVKTVISDKNIRELASQFSKPDYVLKFDKKDLLTQRLNDLNAVDESKRISKCLTTSKKIRDMKMKTYLKFLHEGERKIVDRSSKLSVKAKMITEKIAYEFVQWLKKFEKNVQRDIIEIFKLFNMKFAFPQNAEDSDSQTESASHVKKSKVKKSTIKPKTKPVVKIKEKSNVFEFHQILKMFEIGIHNEATTSVVAEIKEIPIAGLKKVFELAEFENALEAPSYLARLYQNPWKLGKTVVFYISTMQLCKLLPSAFKLEQEAALSKRKEEKERMHYFGSLIKKPPVNFCKSKYMKRLESMEVTFKDITHLRSVKSYCKWLIQNPEREKPQYLLKENMFDMALLSKSDDSLDIIDSGNPF